MTDPLQMAVDALRDTTSGEPTAHARYTRARVLAAVRQQKRRRVLNIAFGLPLAAILIGSGAWAASSQRLPQLVQRVTAVLGWRSPQGPASPKAASKPTSGKAVASVGTRAELAPNGAVDTSSASAVDASSVERPGASGSSSTNPMRGQPSADQVAPRDSQVTELELRLYEQAHHFHFIDRDPGAALTAWGDYLRKFPRGRFAVEASYNRALCMVRLGRNSEAVLALRPFARGAFGNYRQSEASALLEQLAVATPKPAPSEATPGQSRVPGAD